MFQEAVIKTRDLCFFAAKKTIRRALSAFPQSRGIPIIAGPLKGKRLPRESALQNLQMLCGQFEPLVASEILGNSGRINIAYDIGAHVGYMTLVLAERINDGGIVFAFEPVPMNQGFLEKMVNLNGLNGKVRIVPTALGDTAGREKMVIRESPFMNQLESVAAENVKGGPTIVAPVSTLDLFVFAESNPPPDLIKIDVEGAEAKVIAGGMKTLGDFSPVLLLEIHGPENAARSYTLLRNLDYEWWFLRREGAERITDQGHLLSLFSKNAWTHHFRVIRKEMKGQSHAG
jgi:FkbM family methyltransferase